MFEVEWAKWRLLWPILMFQLTVFLIRLRNTTEIVGHNNNFQTCYKPETSVISYRILILAKLYAGRHTKENRPLHKADRFKRLICRSHSLVQYFNLDVTVKNSSFL